MKSKNIIIHIGYPKAASTWLKKSFFPNVENYQLVDNALVIEKIIKPNALFFEGIKTNEYFAEMYNENFIISESMLLGGLIMGGNNGAYTKELCYRLGVVFPNAKILIIIRNQFEALTSAYLEYIKKGGSYSIKKYFSRKINIPLRFSFEYFAYDKLISLYSSIFGKENVNVFLYEDLLYDSKNFINKITKVFDFEIKCDEINFLKNNLAYQRYLFPIVRFSNMFTRKGVFYKRYFVDIPFMNRNKLSAFFDMINNTFCF